METVRRNRIVKGWIPLLGIPALFLSAYALGVYPRVVELPLCGVKLFLNVPCPGCGLTHAFVALAHGRLGASIAYNAMGVVIALWLCYQCCRAMYYLLTGSFPRPLLSDGTRFFLLNIFVAALMLQWIAGLIIRYW